MITGEATTLVVPGRPTDPSPPAGFQGGWLLPALAALVVCGGVWTAMSGRRRRRVDPRELAFRRIAHAQGWSRAQVRALRRAAATRGLGSPVGLALSPTLTAQAVLEHGTRPGRRAASPSRPARAQSA
jgi:hypothetical protein